MSQERRALDATAISVMLLLTALWGFQQVTIKWIAADVSFVAQAAIRSGVLSGVVFLSEPLSAHFALAALLIAAGIALVNLRR